MSNQNVMGRGWLGGGFRTAFGEALALESNAQAWQQKGDEGGDSGVVFGGEMAGLAVYLWRYTNGDIFDLAHGADSFRRVLRHFRKYCELLRAVDVDFS
jgi:hypothetical protein